MAREKINVEASIIQSMDMRFVGDVGIINADEFVLIDKLRTKDDGMWDYIIKRTDGKFFKFSLNYTKESLRYHNNLIEVFQQVETKYTYI